MLRRTLILALVAWTVALPAAGATPAAGRATVRFAVSVEGVQRTEITGVRSSVNDLGCTVRRRYADQQTLSFESRSEGRVAVAVPGGPAFARTPVTVRASSTSRTTTTVTGLGPECDLEPQKIERGCGSSTLRGTAIVRLPARGVVGLGGSLDRRRDASRCRPSAAPARAFLVGSEGQFPAALLTDRSAARIMLRGNARFTDTLASGLHRVTTVRWTVVLRRIS